MKTMLIEIECKYCKTKQFSTMGVRTKYDLFPVRHTHQCDNCKANLTSKTAIVIKRCGYIVKQVLAPTKTEDMGFTPPLFDSEPFEVKNSYAFRTK